MIYNEADVHLQTHDAAVFSNNLDPSCFSGRRLYTVRLCQLSSICLNSNIAVSNAPFMMISLQQPGVIGSSLFQKLWLCSEYQGTCHITGRVVDDHQVMVSSFGITRSGKAAGVGNWCRWHIIVLLQFSAASIIALTSFYKYLVWRIMDGLNHISCCCMLKLFRWLFHQVRDYETGPGEVLSYCRIYNQY